MKRRYYQTLQDSLDELERTNPEVRESRIRYEETVRAILASPREDPFADVTADLYELRPTRRHVTCLSLTVRADDGLERGCAVAVRCSYRLGICDRGKRHGWVLSKRGIPFLYRTVRAYVLVPAERGEPSSGAAGDLPCAAVFERAELAERWAELFRLDIRFSEGIGELLVLPRQGLAS